MVQSTQEARLEKLRRELTSRFRQICGQMDSAEFALLVDEMARFRLKHEEVETQLATRPVKSAVPDVAEELPTSRTHVDPSGQSWTIWEITPGSLPPKLERLLGADVAERGALLFVSESNEWRALTPAPQGWIDFDTSEIEACRLRARVRRVD